MDPDLDVEDIQDNLVDVVINHRLRVDRYDDGRAHWWINKSISSLIMRLMCSIGLHAIHVRILSAAIMCWNLIVVNSYETRCNILRTSIHLTELGGDTSYGFFQAICMPSDSPPSSSAHFRTKTAIEYPVKSNWWPYHCHVQLRISLSCHPTAWSINSLWHACAATRTQEIAARKWNSRTDPTAAAARGGMTDWLIKLYFQV